MRLRTLLATYPHTAPLKKGEVTSDRVAFDFIDVTPVWSGFKAMVRERAFDVSEMAIVTYLIARSFDKPMVLLPAVMTGRIQHAWAIYNAERGELMPSDLASVRWITFEDAHVAEFVDTTERAPPGKTIVQMLLDGELDAVFGERSDDPRIKPLFGDPAAAAEAWYRKHGIVPLNHMVVVSTELAKARPDVVAEIFALLTESKRRAAAAGGVGAANGIDHIPDHYAAARTGPTPEHGSLHVTAPAARSVRTSDAISAHR
jgi:4,5-dihydroxyphthalate decarboxylase